MQFDLRAVKSERKLALMFELSKDAIVNRLFTQFEGLTMLKQVLLLSLVLLVNGSAALAEGSETTGTTPANPDSTKATEGAKSEDSWTEQAASMSFTQKQAAGAINGKSFTATSAILSDNSLILRSGSPKGRIFGGNGNAFSIVFPKAENLVGKTISVKDGLVTGASTLPHINVSSLDEKQGRLSIKQFGSEKNAPDRNNRYGMRLHISQAQPDGLVPGYIILRCPDQSYVSGYFYARVKRHATRQFKMPTGNFRTQAGRYQ